MPNKHTFPLEGRGETISREALVQAALNEITSNYREACLTNVARAYGVSLAFCKSIGSRQRPGCSAAAI